MNYQTLKTEKNSFWNCLYLYKEVLEHKSPLFYYFLFFPVFNQENLNMKILRNVHRVCTCIGFKLLNYHLKVIHMQVNLHTCHRDMERVT